MAFNPGRRNASWSEQVGSQSLVEFINSYGHLEAVEWISHDRLCVYLMTSSSDSVGIGLFRAGEEQELGACSSLEARQAKVRRLKGLNPCRCIRSVTLLCRRDWHRT